MGTLGRSEYGTFLTRGRVDAIHVVGWLKFGKNILCPALNRFDQRKYVLPYVVHNFELPVANNYLKKYFIYSMLYADIY